MHANKPSIWQAEAGVVEAKGIRCHTASSRNNLGHMRPSQQISKMISSI